MATSPSYADYVGNGGQLAEGPFLAALPQAVAAVDETIWPNVVAEITLLKWQQAVCAVVDLIDSPAVASESIGRASFTYAEVPTIAGAIRRHLTGTGLLYRGI